MSEMQKEEKKYSKERGKGQRKRASMTAIEVTSFSPASAVQTRKSSDMSNSNLPCNFSQFHVLLDQPNKKLWQFTHSECYNIKDINLNGIHQSSISEILDL